MAVFVITRVDELGSVGECGVLDGGVAWDKEGIKFIAGRVGGLCAVRRGGGGGVVYIRVMFGYL